MSTINTWLRHDSLELFVNSRIIKHIKEIYNIVDVYFCQNQKEKVTHTKKRKEVYDQSWYHVNLPSLLSPLGVKRGLGSPL